MFPEPCEFFRRAVERHKYVIRDIVLRVGVRFRFLLIPLFASLFPLLGEFIGDLLNAFRRPFLAILWSLESINRSELECYVRHRKSEVFEFELLGL